MIKPEKVKKLFEKFELLAPVVRRLNKINVPWMIGGSGCLFLLGNDRIPEDIDIFLENNAHDTVDLEFKIKSFEYKSPIETVRNSNPEGNHTIQFTSFLQLSLENKQYNLSITLDTIKHRLGAIWDSNKIYILPPEEVLLIKAILQRGPNQGKHDVEDIKVFMGIYPRLDTKYLGDRIRALGVQKRVENIFSSQDLHRS